MFLCQVQIELALPSSEAAESSLLILGERIEWERLNSRTVVEQLSTAFSDQKVLRGFYKSRSESDQGVKLLTWTHFGFQNRHLAW